MNYPQRLLHFKTYAERCVQAISGVIAARIRTCLSQSAYTHNGSRGRQEGYFSVYTADAEVKDISPKYRIILPGLRR